MRFAVLFAWLAAMVLSLLTLPLLPAQVALAGQMVSKLDVVALQLSLVGPAMLLLGQAPLRWVARHTPLLLKIPHRHYWLAPQRFESSLVRLCKHTQWIRLSLPVALAGSQLALLWRSHPDWPQASDSAMGLIFPALSLASLFWVLHMRRLFPRPPRTY